MRLAASSVSAVPGDGGGSGGAGGAGAGAGGGAATAESMSASVCGPSVGRGGPPLPVSTGLGGAGASMRPDTVTVRAWDGVSGAEVGLWEASEPWEEDRAERDPRLLLRADSGEGIVSAGSCGWEGVGGGAERAETPSPHTASVWPCEPCHLRGSQLCARGRGRRSEFLTGSWSLSVTTPN